MRLFGLVIKRRESFIKEIAKLYDNFSIQKALEFEKGTRLGFMMGQIEERNKQFAKKYPPMSRVEREAHMIAWEKEAKDGEL